MNNVFALNIILSSFLLNTLLKARIILNIIYCCKARMDQQYYLKLVDITFYMYCISRINIDCSKYNNQI